MDPFLGQIMIFAGTYAPKGWALCNGQLLSIQQNSALFSLLGVTYGGDGRTTFALPGGTVFVGIPRKDDHVHFFFNRRIDDGIQRLEKIQHAHGQARFRIMSAVVGHIYVCVGEVE
jgi:hypothetical protein